MSETAKTIQPQTRRKTTIFIFIAVILLLVYGGGVIALPVSILAQYKNKDCDSVLSLNGMYKRIYPAAIQNRTLAGPVQECAVYVLATQHEEQSAWRDAYNAYQEYSSTYTNGLFTKEAREHAAHALVEIAKKQISDGQYEEALTSLAQVASTYSDTEAAAEVPDVTVSLYDSWMEKSRSLGNFEETIQILVEYESWVQTNHKTELEAGIKLEQAKTYFEWGLSLQSQKQFEAAKTKFEIAASTDPDVASSDGIAAQVKANEAKLQMEWGNALFEQKNFESAIAHYQNAIAAGQDQVIAQDAIVNAYILLATELSTKEDFLGALKKLDLAKEQSATDAMSASVEKARQKVYLDFSNSSGTQAQKAIQDAVKLICEKGNKPELPIFGVNTATHRVGVNGIDINLPDDLVARAPAELNYVVCVVVVNHVVQERYYNLSRHPTNHTMAWETLHVHQKRIRVFWNITLWAVDESKKLEENSLAGSFPPPYPTEWGLLGDGLYYGEPPFDYELIEWLNSVIKK